MKKILIILIGLCSVYNANAKEYIFNGYGVSKQYSINVSDNYKFSSYTSEGMWDDSNGDYGNEKCAGNILELKNKKIRKRWWNRKNENFKWYWKI